MWIRIESIYEPNNQEYFILMQMPQVLSFEIASSTSSSELKYLSENLGYMKRTEQISKHEHRFDVFPSRCILGLADLPPQIVSIRSDQNWQTLSGALGFFIPPFSILEWQLTPGAFTWHCYSFSPRFLDTPPQEPLIFSWDKEFPKDLHSIQRMIQTAKQPQRIFKTPPSPIALRAKALIDRKFKENIPLQDFVEELKVSRVIIAREFIKSYGISPVQYRHRLRIFAAFDLVNSGKNVTDAAIEVGITAPGRFAGDFKKVVGTYPSRCGMNRAYLDSHSATPITANKESPAQKC